MQSCIYFVNADYVNPVGEVIGAGAACKSLQEAEQEQARYQSNPKFTNVTITKRTYGSN